MSHMPGSLTNETNRGRRKHVKKWKTIRRRRIQTIEDEKHISRKYQENN